MNEDLAEAAGEGLVSFDIEILVAKEDDAMLVQRGADLADRGGVEILGRVDTGNLRAARAG